MSGTNIDALEPMKFAFISKPKVDDYIFRLHYKLTTKMLMVFVALTMVNTIGNNIVCYSTDRALPTDILNSYCSMQNTFIVAGALNREVGSDVAHPGVGTYVAGSDDTRIYQRYYIWIPVFLVIQAALFFTPHYIWRNCEPKKLNRLLVSLDRPIVVVVDEGLESLCKYVHRRRDYLAIYLYESWGSHRLDAFQYFTCVGLCLINVIGQIFYVDHMLEGEFLSYGPDVMGVWWGTSDPSNRTDPMTRIFPRMSKCTYRQFGAGGSVQNHDVLCAMPFNIYYEKIFIVIWFWYILLAVLTGGLFIYFLAAMTIKPFRNWLLLPAKPKVPDTASSARNVDDEDENKNVDGESGGNQERIPLKVVSIPTPFSNERPSPSNDESVSTKNLINAANGRANGHAGVVRGALPELPQPSTVPYDVLSRNLEAGDLGDWFLLRLLSLNISGNHFEKVMARLDLLLRKGNRGKDDPESMLEILRNK